MKKVGIAVIGCGTIANSAHIPSYVNNPDADILYFCDIIPERAEAAAAKYGTARAVTGLDEILADPAVEAVSVCVPNDFHAPISIACMKAGKHVLCEKPAARTLDEVLEMQQAQHETGMILNIGVVNRFNVAVNRVRAMIQSGELGEVYHVYGSFRAHRSIPGLGGYFTTKSAAGGGVLIDWGVHYLDIIMYCLNDPALKTVSGQAYCKLGRSPKDYVYTDMWAGPPKLEGTYDVDDFVTALVRTHGPTININGSWAQNIGVQETFIDFIGDKAGIRLQYGGNYKVFGTKDGALYELTPSYPAGSHFQAEIDAFVRCVRTGEKLPSHIDTVLVTARLMQAIYDSSESGKEICLED